MRVIRIGAFWRRGSVEGAADRAHRMALQAANAIRQMSGGRWDVEGFGCVMPEEFWKCDVSAPRYGIEEMRATWDMLQERPDLWPSGVDRLPLWRPTHWHMLGGWFQGQCGQANLRGTAGRTNTDMGCGLSTMIHELGHNFGLLHSNRMDANGKVREYKDRSGYMGSSAPISNHAAHQYALELRDDDEVLRVTKNATVKVVPWEMPRRARHDDEHAFLEVYTGTRFPLPDQRPGRIFVSTRKMKGYPWKVAGNEPRVWVHYEDGLQSILLHTLALGQKAKVDSATIEYFGQVNETAAVKITFDADNTPLKHLVERKKDDLPWSPAPGVLPPDGVYFNPMMNGQGLDLHVGQGKASLFWYAQTDSEEPDWHVAVFDESNVADLFTWKGGTFADPKAGHPQTVGRVRLLRHGERTFLDYSTTVHGRGSVEMVSIGTGSDDRNGAYFNPTRNGEGFTLRWLSDDRVVGYWYTFTDNGRRRWYLLDGPPWALDVYAARGAFIRHNVGQSHLTPAGEAALEEDDGQYRFTFEDFSTVIQRLTF